MPPEPTVAPDEAQDPIADTPEPTAEAPAEDTPQAEQPVVDSWEARYKDLEQAFGRQGNELGMFRRGEAPEPEPVDEEAETASAQPTPAGISERYVADSWDKARALYGDTAVEAYDAVYRLYANADTPSDHMAYLWAFHEMVSAGASPKQAAAAVAPAGKSRAEALQPRVDPNRTDAGPDPSIEKQIEEAKGKGDLLSWASGQVKKLGLG